MGQWGERWGAPKLKPSSLKSCLLGLVFQARKFPVSSLKSQLGMSSGFFANSQSIKPERLESQVSSLESQVSCLKPDSLECQGSSVSPSMSSRCFASAPSLKPESPKSQVSSLSLPAPTLQSQVSSLQSHASSHELSVAILAPWLNVIQPERGWHQHDRCWRWWLGSQCKLPEHRFGALVCWLACETCNIDSCRFTCGSTEQRRVKQYQR